MKSRGSGKRREQAPGAEAEPTEFVRRYEGRAVLEKLLAASGTRADVDDVIGAFREAAKVNAPPPVVIQALWDDEPRFEGPAQAERLFSNLLALADLIAAGEKLEEGPAGPSGASGSVKVKRVKVEHPGAHEGPLDDAYVEAAWRYFDDHPKERERAQHAFENRQDALLSWFELQPLSDLALGVVLQRVSDVFAMLELSGKKLGSVRERDVPETVDAEALPSALTKWVDEAVVDAEEDETQPLPETEAATARDVAFRAIAALLARVG